MVLLANTLSIVFLFTGCGLLTAILLRRSYGYFGELAKRRAKEAAIEAQPRPTSAWSGMQKDAAAHVERQKVELQEMARDVAGQLDSKMIVLRQLISQSNGQIERIERLLAELERQRV